MAVIFATMKALFTMHAVSLYKLGLLQTCCREKRHVKSNTLGPNSILQNDFYMFFCSITAITMRLANRGLLFFSFLALKRQLYFGCCSIVIGTSLQCLK